MHKRKHRRSVRDDNWEQSTHTTTASRVQSTFSAEDTFQVVPDPCLYVQAHEADIVRRQPSRSLEFQSPSLMNAGSQNAGSDLIRWGESGHSYDTDTTDIHASNQPQLWVDRYDARLLLDQLPPVWSENAQERPLSASGWSDLPSDSEDTFFFSPDELEDYRREKRRRLMDRGREERLRALAAIEGEEDADPWGGSDEEPDETQRELIRRTACHIISSPNPAQLEMRILTNYGSDERFAFLRGRWSRIWRTEKERARQCLTKRTKTQPPPASTPLGGLVGYGDSDSDGDSEVDKSSEGLEDAVDTPRAQDQHSNEDDIKEARRARAREWSARRREEQSSHSEQR